MLISSYCHMFDLTACVFRFGNVVGPRQTHGVGFDFVRSLRKEPARLKILGDGGQSKSYIYVEDVIAAVLAAPGKERKKIKTSQGAAGDYITGERNSGVGVGRVQLERRKGYVEVS